MEFWATCTGDEWHIASRRQAEFFPVVTGEEVPRPDNVQWRRFAAGADAVRLLLAPALPDRPVIVRPAANLQILPGQSARFLVSVPPWSRFLIAGTETLLCEEPTVVLSSSWFGTPVEGEICYALRSTARRSFAELVTENHRAVCPVRIHNSSLEPLDFQRLCLRVKHLNLYAGKTRVWSNETNVIYRGPVVRSQLSYSETPPDLDDASALIADAREKPEQGFLARTFDNSNAFAPL